VRTLAALLLAPGLCWGQFATIQRERKIASGTASFTGTLSNDSRFGVSVAELGDFDGDGIRDLAVGSHRANIGGAERGAVWLLYLRADGSVREHRQISALSGNLSGPLDDHDRFGISLCSLGDLDLDGTPDLAVGAYRDDDGGTDYGCVYVLFLAPDGTVKAEQKISQLAGGFTGELGIEDSFGWSVESPGDLDDDGIPDLVVSATRDDGLDPEPTKDIGALHILFLNADGTVKVHSKIGPETPGLGVVLRPRDRFGSDVVRIEDADGDGVEDLAVGAFGEDPQKYGRVFLLYLNPDGTLKDWREIGFNTGGFTGLLGKGDRFGMSLAADDFDGDGRQDLLVGAAGDDDGGADVGALWMCLLNPLGRVKAFEKISPDYGGFGGFLRPGDNFGISATVLGDLDRDGAFDLAVGSYQDDTGGFDRGAAWVLFRQGTGTPVADFVSTPNHGEIPLTVAFTDRSTGPITSWSWDFGDGTTSDMRHPTHLFTGLGVHDVRLTVSGPQGTDTLLRQRTVVVQPLTPPDADFVLAPASGPAPHLVGFADRSSGTVTSWNWDFGDGTSSDARNPKKLYEAVGTYSVTLTATGPLGTSQRSALDAVQALVPPPAADFMLDPALGFVPLEVRFTDLSANDLSAWAWDFGDGTTSSERNPVHVYAAVGTYDVTLTAFGPGGSDTHVLSGAVRVAPPMEAAFTFVPPTSVAPVSVQFTDASSGTPSAWSWDFGDGTLSLLRNPSHAFASGGLFPVTLTVTRGGLSRSLTQLVAIPEPRPDARFAVSAVSGALPLRVSFTDQSIGNITRWEWDFGDGTSSFERNPSHTYRRPGLFTVRFRVTSAGGVDGLVRTNLIRVTGKLPTLLPTFGPRAASGLSRVPRLF
jgi:PKD repeat protein